MYFLYPIYYQTRHQIYLQQIISFLNNSSLQTVSKLVTAAGETLKPFLARLIPALAGAAGELESARLSYLATALADSTSRDVLDDMRASAAKHHYTTDTVVKVIKGISYDVTLIIMIVFEILRIIIKIVSNPHSRTLKPNNHFSPVYAIRGHRSDERNVA